MEGSQEKYCMLCSTLVKNGDYKLIEGRTKEAFKFLLSNLNLDGNKQIICSDCSVKLFETYSFKEMCLKTEDTISPYINTSAIQLQNLRDIFIMERRHKEPQVALEGLKVCRLCMQLAKHDMVPFRETDKNMIREFIPEMNFNATIDPIICKKCYDSFFTYSSFLKNCSNLIAQKKSRGNDKTAIDTHTIASYIKTEEIDIKTEEDNGKIEEPFEIKFFNVKEEIKHESDTATEDEIKPCIPEEIKPILSHTIPSARCINVIDMPAPKTRRSSIFEFRVPQLRREAYASFKCDKCNYETASKDHLTWHELKHKRVEEMQLHKCNRDTFETMQKNCILTDVDGARIHGQSTNVNSADQIFKCDECGHETRYRKEFISHLLKHKDLWNEPLYKCDKCDFETKFKQRLMLHEFKHKDTTDVGVFKCDKCNFASPHKPRLALHRLTHRDTVARTYSCNICTFETKVKKSLKVHQLRHRDPSELQMYKCNKCEFQTKRKDSLKMHQWRHKDPSERRKFKCDECDYESNQKVNLTRHALRHRKPSDGVMVKCDQ